MRQPPRTVAWALLVLYAAGAAVMVLAPDSDLPTDAAQAIWRLLRDAGAPGWVSEKGVELVLNIVLFVPLSFIGAMLRPRWGWLQWLGVGFALTFAVELVQGMFLPDRTPDVVDMVANSLGALVGYWLFLLTWRKSG
ncbi:MAG TPA: VanZ family protein [Nocardioidaceae bacterium]